MDKRHCNMWENVGSDRDVNVGLVLKMALYAHYSGIFPSGNFLHQFWS